MQLFEHQKKILELNPDKHLLAWSCGTGKTLTAIQLALKEDGHRLVICPKSLVDNWRAEIDKWGGYGLGFVVMSKENFKKQCSKDINWCRFTTVILDEGHFFSNLKSQLTKSLINYLKIHSPKRIYILTATPYLSSPWNIYAYAAILGITWHWLKFKKFFFYDMRMGNRTIPVAKKGMENEIAKLINKLGNTVKMEDCWDVPEQIFQYESFSLSNEQRSAISSLMDLSPIVRFTKEHQICGGTLKGDGYDATKRFKSEKLTRLLEIIELNNQVAIICRYNEEINYLYESIKSKYPGKNIWRITGSVSGEERHYIVEEINKSTDAIVLINAACSEGYGLPAIPLMVFYSYDFSLKNYIQMLGRIQRAGHIKKNVYLSLVTKDSIDERIYKSVAIDKKDFQTQIYE